MLREGLWSGWACCAEGRFVVRLGVLCWGKVCGQAGRVVLGEGLWSGWACCAGEGLWSSWVCYAEGRFVVELGVLC